VTERTVALVVPVYNERSRFADFADELLAFIARQAGGSELIFVDDGSSDGTADEIERRLQDGHAGHARVIRRQHEGKGAAVSSGIESSTADVIAFCDVDLSTPLSDLERIIETAGRAPVLAIGSRDVSGSVLARSQGPIRKALGRAFNRLMQATITPGVVDTQCGAKAARSEVWRDLLRYCSQSGFAWDAEVIGVALASGVEVQEIAITWRHDDRSQVNVMADGIAMVRQTPRLLRAAAAARAASDAQQPQLRVPDATGEVFDATNAARMQAVDRTHWWFRSKAAFVATALRRTGAAPPTGWLLDAGGGSGGVSAMLGWPTDRVIVVEGNQDLVGAARARSGLAAAQGSVHELPVVDSSMAVVCLLDVIEHLDEPEDALREAARALRADGRLVVNVPAHRWLWSQADVELGHRRRYTRAELRAALRAIGFEPIVLTHVFSWLVPPVWFVRRLASTGSAELGLDRRSLPIDIASLVLTAIERELIGRVRLPFGTSILCVARRRG
jgi:dolichyl-phosphate beta-glucosyltransferase